MQQISGNAFRSDTFTSDGVPAVKISNIGYSVFVVKNQEYLPKSFLSEFKNYIIHPDDLLIALTRLITNNTTKVCFYPLNVKPALLNQRVAVLKSEDIIIKKYVFYYFQSEEFKKFLKSKLNETLQPNLSPKDLVNAQVPFCEKENKPKSSKK